MRKLNVIIVEGKLTRDPEVKTFASGQTKTVFSVAVDRSYKKGDAWEKKTAFIDCQMWGKDGEAVAESRSKGDFVVVTGAIDQDQWETDGQKRNKTFIAAESCKHLHNPFGDKEPETGSKGRSSRVHAGNYRQKEDGPSRDLDFDKAMGEDVSDDLPF